MTEETQHIPSITGDPIVDKTLNNEYSRISSQRGPQNNPFLNMDAGEGEEQPLFKRTILPDYVMDVQDIVDNPAALGTLTADDVNEVHVQDQSIMGNIARGHVRTLGRIGSELAHMIGYMGGSTAQLGQNIGSSFGWVDKPKDLSLIFDNAFNRGVDNIFNSVFESENSPLKTYIPKKVKEGSLIDNLGSSEFWATEGADAIGFFASMLVPGAAMSKLGIGNKVMSGLSKIKPITNLLEAVGGAGAIDNVLSAAVNTTFESASEASNTYQDIKNGLLAKGETPEIANMIASSKAAQTFNTNMALLIGPEMLMSKWGFGRFNPAGKEFLEVAEQGVKKTGKEFTKTLVPKILKNVPKGILSEGIFEEGVQNSVQDYLTKQGLNKEENKGFLEGIQGIAKSYGNLISSGDVNMQKSIFLGGLLGGIGAGVGAYRSYKNIQNKIYGTEGSQSKIGKFLAKFPGGDLFASEPQKGIKQIIDENLLSSMPEALSGAIQKDDKGNYKLTEDAKGYLYNPDSVNLLGEDQIKKIATNKILEDAQLSGDKNAVDQYINLTQFNMMKPFLDSDDSIAYLKRYFIPQQSDIMLGTIEKYRQNMTQEDKNELTPEFINKRKEELIQKVDKFKDIYNETKNRHSYETKLKYDPKYKQEYQNFMNQVMNVKLQSKVDLQFAKNKISELESRNNELISRYPFKEVSPSQLKVNDLVDFQGEKFISLGGKKILNLNTLKTYTLADADKPKKLDYDDQGDLNEILDNMVDIHYNKQLVDKAKNEINSVYDNKALQKILDERINKAKNIEAQDKFAQTFRPNTYWIDKGSKEKFKIKEIDGKPVLFKETKDDKGNSEYNEEVQLSDDLLIPENFKKRFEEIASPEQQVATEENTDLPIEESEVPPVQNTDDFIDNEQFNEELQFKEDLKNESLRNANINRISNIIDKSINKKDLTERELYQNEETLNYLEENLEKNIVESGNRLKSIDKELEQSKELLSQKKRPNNNKKLISKIEDLEQEKKDIIEITRSFQNRIRELRETKQILESKKQDLINRISYYKNLLHNENFKLFSKNELENEIKRNKGILGTINKILHAIETAIKKFVSMLKDLDKIISQRSKNENEHNYDSDPVEYQFFIDELVEKEQNKKSELLDKAIRLQNNIRYLQDLIQSVEQEINKSKQVREQKKIIPNKPKQIISKNDNVANTKNKSTNSLKDLDKKTIGNFVISNDDFDEGDLIETSIDSPHIVNDKPVNTLKAGDSLMDMDTGEITVVKSNDNGIITTVNDDVSNNSVDDIDTSPINLEPIEDYGLKRSIFDAYIGTANNANIGKTKESKGNLNSIKANKVASDFNIYNGDYQLTAIKASDVFPNDEEFFKSEAGTAYNYNDLIILALTDKSGNLIGLNEDWNNLIPVGKNTELNKFKDINKPFIYWALREADPTSKAIGEKTYYKPGLDKIDFWKSFPIIENALKGITNPLEIQNIISNLADNEFKKLEDQLLSEYKQIRKNLIEDLKKGKPVNLNIIGHSSGIANTGDIKSAIEGITEVEKITPSKLIATAKIKVATENFIDFGYGNQKPSSKGYTYVNTESGKIYEVQPRKLNEKEINNIIDLFTNYENNINNILKNKNKTVDNLTADDFKEAEKFYQLNEDGEKELLHYDGATIFGYLSDLIHNNYLNQTQIKDKEGRNLILRKRDLSGNYITVNTPIFVKIAEDDKTLMLNPEIIDSLKEVLSDRIYHRVKAVKLNNSTEKIFVVKSVDTKNGIVNITSQNYNEYLLKDILTTNVSTPPDVTVNLKPEFGGGTKTFTPPVFENVYLKLDLTKYKNKVEDVKDLTESSKPYKESEFKKNLKDNQDDIDDSGVFRKRLNLAPYTKEDLDTTKQWFIERFPQFGEEGFKVVNDLLSKGIFGKVANYAMYLDSEAELGTGYHEAFHMTTHYLLTDSERKSLYKEYNDRFQSELTSKEVEERLAEDFRYYMLNNGQIEYPKIQENIFKKLWRWIKSFFNSSIMDTFKRINNGYYSKRNIRSNTEISYREDRFFKSDNPIQASRDFYKEVMQATNTYFFDEIRKSEGSFESFFNKDKNAELINATYKKVKENFENNRKDIQEYIDELKAKPELTLNEQRRLDKNLERLEHFNFILDQFKDAKSIKAFRRKHANELMEFGLATSLIEDTNEADEVDDNNTFNQETVNETTDNTETSKDVVWNLSDLSIKFDAKFNATKSIKLLVGTVPELYVDNNGKYVRKKNPILQTPRTLNFGSTFNTILNNLTGIKGLEEVITKLQELKKEVPSIQYFFNEYGLDLEKIVSGNLDIPKTKFNEIMQFVQTFAKTANNFTVDILNEGGKVDMLDTNLQTQRKGILTQWRNNSSAIALTSSNPVLSKENIYNASHFTNTQLNDMLDVYDFLEELGIEYTNKEKIQNLGLEGILKDKATKILNSIKKGSQVNLFATNVETNHGNDLNELIDVEYYSNIDLNVLSHIGPDGQSIYNHSLNSFISNVFDNINKFDTWDELVSFYPHLNSEVQSWLGHSLLLKKGGLLFNEDGLRRNKTDLVLHTIEAVSANEGEDKVEFNKLSQVDRMRSVIDRAFKGQFDLIRPADKSLERLISIGNSKENRPIDTFQAVEYYKGYLIDDVNFLKAQKSNPIQWNNVNKNTSGITIEIIRKFNSSPSLLERFEKVLANGDSIEEYLLNTENNSFVKKAIQNYLNFKSERLFNWLVKNDLLIQNGELFRSEGITFSKTTTLFSREELLSKLKDFTVMDDVMNTEQLKLIFGNPNLYKDVDNFYKRTGGFPGTKKLAVDDYITSTYIQDNLKRTDKAEGLTDTKVGATVNSLNKSRSRKKSIIKQIVFDDPEVYDDIFGKVGEETDGYSMVSFDTYRELLFRTGDWSFGENSLEDLYQYEMQKYYGSKMDKEEFYNIFGRDWDGTVKVYDDITKSWREVTERPSVKINMLKPQYIGPYAESGSQLGFTKTSFGILYPSFVKSKPNLEKLMNFVRKHQIGVVSFASANKGITTKLNNNGKLNQLYTSEGQLNLDNLTDKEGNLIAVTQDTYTENWGVQLDTGFKNKHDVIYGTQMMKQIKSYMYANGKIKDEFKDLESILNEYDLLNGQRLDLGKQQLLNELDVTESPEGYIIKDYNKFKSKLKKLADLRGMDDNTYDSINFIEPTLGMDILLNRSKFESAIYSLNNSRVIKQKRNGGAYYQMPSTLFESSGLRTYENDTLKSSEDLKVYQVKKDKNGNIISVGAIEVLLPSVYKGIPIEQLENKLKEGIAFRIPTQGLASIEAIKIKGFLDESAGDIVVLPSAIIKKAGSDYDIDKLNIYLPYNYKTKDGNYTYISYNPETLEKDYITYIENRDLSEKELSKEDYQKAAIENRITEIQKEIILHPANYSNLVKTLDDTKDKITELVNKIYKQRIGNDRGKGNLIDIIDRINLTNVADRFLSSKQAVGITALASPFHILAQKADLYVAKTDDKGNFTKINFPHNEKDGKIYLGGELDKNGENIAEILRQWISEAVDAAKDPRMFDLNVNLETLNVVLYMTMAGVPTETIMYFINQPVIHDYLNLKSIGKSLVKSVNKRTDSRTGKTISAQMTDDEIRKNIIAKYGGNSSEAKEYSVEELSKYIDFGRLGKISEADDVKDIRIKGYSTSDFAKAQVFLLNEYLKYKETANLLTTAIQGASWDTNSAGKSTPELLLRLHNAEKALNTKSLIKTQDKIEEGESVLGNYNNLLQGEQSFIEPYYRNNKNLVKEFAPLFKVLLGNSSVNSITNFLIERFDTELGLSNEDKITILNNIIPDYITYNLVSKGLNKDLYKNEDEFNKAIESQTNNINAQKDKLFQGSKSVAKRLDYFQQLLKDFKSVERNELDNSYTRNRYGKDKGEFSQEKYDRIIRIYQKFKDNALVNTLIPNISSEEEYYDHVILQNRKRDLLETLKLVDGWNQLLEDTDYINTPDDLKELGTDLIKLLAKQEGIKPSSTNFIHLVPAKVYTDFVKNAMDFVSKDEETQQDDVFKFLTEYHIQNFRNSNLVPLKAKAKRKSELYPFIKGQRILKKGISEDKAKEMVSKGKAVYQPIPSIILKENFKSINEFLPNFYDDQTRSRRINLYGETKDELIGLVNSIKDFIFAPKVEYQVNKESIDQEDLNKFNKTLNDLKEAFENPMYSKVFEESGIKSIKDLVNLSDKEKGELLKKLCK